MNVDNVRAILWFFWHMTPHRPGEDAGWNHCLANKQDTVFTTCFKTCDASGRFLSRTCFSNKCFLPFPAALLWSLELSFAFLVTYTQMDWQIQQAETESWDPLQRHLARGWRVRLCSCTTPSVSRVTSFSSLTCVCLPVIRHLSKSEDIRVLTQFCYKCFNAY